MARASGIVCDRCKKFEYLEGNGQSIPNGWISLRVQVNGSGNSVFEVCSNKCLAALARDREKAEREVAKPAPVGVVKPTDASDKPNHKMDQAEAAEYARHRRYHVNADDLRDDCKFCQILTAPEIDLTDSKS